MKRHERRPFVTEGRRREGGGREGGGREGGRGHVRVERRTGKRKKEKGNIRSVRSHFELVGTYVHTYIHTMCARVFLGVQGHASPVMHVPGPTILPPHSAPSHTHVPSRPTIMTQIHPSIHPYPPVSRPPKTTPIRALLSFLVLFCSQTLAGQSCRPALRLPEPPSQHRWFLFPTFAVSFGHFVLCRSVG